MSEYIEKLMEALTNQYKQPYAGPVRGMLKPGNIDLENRPGLLRPDYSHSTVSTITGGLDHGKSVLLPTVIGGVQHSGKEAMRRFRDTGEHMGIFEDEDLANEYDRLLHEKMGWTGKHNKW